MHYYLIKIQYLGFRYHGWAKQKNVKTIHEVIDKSLQFVFGHNHFKTHGSSRTDAMVSANEYSFELFIDSSLNTADFIKSFNSNLPPDVKALNIEQTNEDFNIIQSSKLKEYVYLFSFGEKFHPFCAPLMALFPYNLNIETMKEGAQIFNGTHNFKNYCTKPSSHTKFIRTITNCEIIENNLYSANFFPEKSYLLKICSMGFMRNQVRLMMGQLVELGQGVISLAQLKNSLKKENTTPFKTIVPASGLILEKQWFTHK